jgi:hypothetical protein
LQADTWYHLVATYDGESLKAYKDGVLITENTDPSGSPTPEPNSLKFGRHAAFADYFGGTIDDVRIYNRALAAVDVQELFKMRAPDIETGLVGHWKLDETSGAAAYDSSGNDNDGTLVGDPQWVEGKMGGGLQFDGVDDYVETSYTTDLATWTVSVWVTSPAAPDGDAPSGPVHREQNFQINWDHGDPNYRAAGGLNVGGSWYPASFGTLEADTWYHLAVTYDGESLKAYRDGVLITENTVPSGTPTSEPNSLKFGRHAAAAQFFTGTIDEVRVYHRALSAVDVQELFKTRPPDIEAGLVGHWRLNETSGAVAYDSSGNANHGTVFGNPQWVAGKVGGGLDMDGTDDYVALPIGSLIGSLTNSTFATWVNFSNDGGGWQRMFDFGSDMTYNMFLTPRTGTDGPMRFAITISGGGAEERATAPFTLPSGWHHMAVTINADDAAIRLFLDGVAVADNAAATLTPSDLGNTTQNWLGRSQYPADAYFDGALDDFRVYDRVLSDQEVRELFRSGQSFRITQVLVEPTGGFQLTWTSTPGVGYVIWSCTNLTSGDWTDEEGVPSGGESTSWTDPNPDGSRKFYRVEQY